MTNKQILEIAMRQSAVDSSCCVEDFCTMENKVVISQKNPIARQYLDLPFSCDLVSYGDNIVASVNTCQELADFIKNYINDFPVEHCFETPNLYVLNVELEKYYLQICHMAEYFLPDVNKLYQKENRCGYALRTLKPADFADLYLPQWSNALCEKRKKLDVLGVGAYDNGKLIGFAGASADCDSMWQIGIDVLPDYRKKGIASALTNTLARDILALGKVPFYCAAWSNIKSVRNAIKSGFIPAWVQMTAKPRATVELMNQI